MVTKAVVGELELPGLFRPHVSLSCSAAEVLAIFETGRKLGEGSFASVVRGPSCKKTEMTVMFSGEVPFGVASADEHV